MPIVFGTDFSETSRGGAKAAAAIADRLGREFWLVHVLDPAFEALGGREGEAEAGARQRLEHDAALLHETHPSLRVQSAVLRGSVHESIARFAESIDASLLVVSSQGHGASPLYRLGGTSERIAVETEGPFLVLRGGESFERWGRGERPLRVLLGIDETGSSEPAIAWVKSLRRAGACDVIAVHVYFPHEARRRYGMEGPASLVEADPELERLLERDIAMRVGEMPGEGTVSFRAKLGLGRLADHLLDVAERERVDLVVVGTHRRRGLLRLASVSGGALHLGRMAVACIPEPKTAASEPRSLPFIARVLVATDFSSFAGHAVRYGYALAGREGSEVVLLHVADESAGKEDEDAEIAARLRALVPPAEVGRGARTRTEVVRDADVPGAICAAAERLAADVICIASHGRTGIGRAVLGSVAEQVMRQSRRPVLVIRPPI